MDAPNLYGLVMDDEPTAQEHAAALSAALRRQQALGTFGQLTGDRVLSGVGTNLASNAQQGQQLLAQTGEKRLQRKVEGERNAALAQYHQDLVGQKEADLQNQANHEGKYAPKFTGTTQLSDGTSVSTNTLTGEQVVGHVSAKKLGRGLGGGRGGAGGGGDGFSPAALDQAAWSYLDTKTMPSLGSGASAAALKVKIANRAAELDGEANLSGNASEYKANSKALASLREQKSKTDILENTATKNLDVALAEASKLTDMGSSILNLPMQKVQSMLGSEQLARYNAARQTAVGEAGKLLNGATGSGGLSEGARHEVETLIAPGASLGQIKAAVDIIKRDLHNRQAAADEQIEGLSAKLSHKERRSGGAPAATPPAGAHASPALQSGEVLMVDPKGIPHAVPAAQVDAALAHKWTKG